ncbi:MAG TPA: HypC/HybG/HupF family hydrogenase formation chaperone [Candidatus Aquicultor sp.]
MCLAVPAKVVSIDENMFTADVDVLGNTKKISLLLTPDAGIGSWVLVHAGQAISVVTDEEAQTSIAIWEEILGDES